MIIKIAGHDTKPYEFKGKYIFLEEEISVALEHCRQKRLNFIPMGYLVHRKSHSIRFSMRISHPFHLLSAIVEQKCEWNLTYFVHPPIWK